MSSDLSPLDAAQIAAFKEQGYLAIDSIATPDEVERMRDAYDRLFDAQIGREKGDHFDLAGVDEEDRPAKLQQMLGPSLYAPEFNSFECRETALAAARQILGKSAEPQGEHAIMKPAGFGAATPWHQDESYWDPKLEYHSLSVWVPLQEATLENGCMQFIPGSHQLGVLPHRPINNDRRIHGLEVETQVETARAVACPIPAGGATFHFSRTLHYAGENLTDKPRRAYIMVFGLPRKPFPGERSFSWLKDRETAREKRAASAKSVVLKTGLIP